MTEIVSAVEMRRSDLATIAGGVSGRELMHRAARGIFESYSSWQGPTAILCGGGNNAGDGYALALLLQEAGVECRILRVSDQLSEDGAFYLSRCLEAGIPVDSFCADKELSWAGEIVDCIFGTGFHGVPEGLAKSAIEAINRAGRPVVSADINSGLDATSGRASVAVRSDLTVSIGTRKYGHYLADAKDYIGQLANVDIGIPILGKRARLLSCEAVREILGERRQNSHKGDFGYVAILGGCAEYAGAVKLSSMGCAALRAGCGVATVAIPASISDAVAPYLLESTLTRLPDDGEGGMRFSPEALDALCKRHSALALGMGWGRREDNPRILEYILKEKEIRLIIDADGLYALSVLPHEILAESGCHVVLTPHMGEFARLVGRSVEEISKDPVEVAEEYAARMGVTLLLKGATTVVTDGKETYLVDRGSAGMATAGSGDVLSGVLCGLLGSRGADPLTVAAGAYLAGRAGELAALEMTPIAMLASDTVAMLPRAIREITERKIR